MKVQTIILVATLLAIEWMFLDAVNKLGQLKGRIECGNCLIATKPEKQTVGIDAFSDQQWTVCTLP